MREEEKNKRARLGIPDDATRVLIIGESSHWDPNWLLTSREYYRWRVKKIISAAIAELEKDSRRVFTVESLFFLKLFYERNPDRQEQLRRLVNEGRLRLAGCGMTSPDTTLPSAEAIFRDYLLGKEWLRKNRMTQKPRVFYFPDDFGHSPALPDLLAAMDVEMTAVTRIDGMFFPGTDYRPRKDFPLPGSSARLLMKDLKTLDFLWRGPRGGEVLCHWNAFTYFQGDMLAHRGVARWMGLTLGLPDRSPERVAARIESIARRLAKLSKTPYLFCPIGCDFVDPIPDLLSLLDEYNRLRFPDTGLYAVNAGLDDYLDLVSCRKETLPALELDPNPYWMGFYSARPSLKQKCRDITGLLLAAEAGLALSPEPKTKKILEELDRAWELIALSNHHDFITGTSPDRVYQREQKPWLQQADKLAKDLLQATRLEKTEKTREASPPPSWTLSDGRLVVENDFYRVELSESAGGCITSWLDRESGEELLQGLGNDVLLYEDTGGLWRMGHEFRGGRFRELARASSSPASISVEEKKSALKAQVSSFLQGVSVIRLLWFRGDSPAVRMELSAACPLGRSLNVRFSTASRMCSLFMDVPGGALSRPLTKIYTPAFWPAWSFARPGVKAGRTLAFFFSRPAAVCGDENGGFEFVALRNAAKERAFGFLPLLGHPARGEEKGVSSLSYAVRAASAKEGPDMLSSEAREIMAAAWLDPSSPGPWAVVCSRVEISPPECKLCALKPAADGRGIIVRVRAFQKPGGPVKVRIRGATPGKVMVCDALERDLFCAELKEGQAQAEMSGPFLTLRFLPEENQE